MKLKDQTQEQIQAVADAAGFKTGVLKLVGKDLDVELRDGKPYVLGTGGAATELSAHIGAQEDGAEILEALALEPGGISFPAQGGRTGGAPDPTTALLDNYTKNKYKHVLDKLAKPAGRYDHVLNPNKDTK